MVGPPMWVNLQTVIYFPFANVMLQLGSCRYFQTKNMCVLNSTNMAFHPPCTGRN
jgi:hypothetical protein